MKTLGLWSRILILSSSILNICIQADSMGKASLSEKGAGVVNKQSVDEKGKYAIHSFPLDEVRLLDGPFKVLEEGNHRFLIKLEADRILYNHRANAGLPSQTKPLGSCEAQSMDIRGQFTGHYLSACALTYASTGDESLKIKSAYIVSELARCQEALGGEYLSAFPESFFDRLENGELMWASYYVVHKVMAGLYDQYSLCGNQQALDVLKKMASYFRKRIAKVPASVWDNITATHEYGGFGEVMYNLYSVTGDPNDLWLARKFDQPAFTDPLVWENNDIRDMHANTHIPVISGIARAYEITGDEKYKKIAINFFNCVNDKRSYVTGGSSKTEWYWRPETMPETLCPYNQEFCTSYNLLKLTRHLHQWTGDIRYADYYERMIINSVMAAFDANSMVTYFTPMTTGFAKVFGSEEIFWCCTGTGIESLARLQDEIYTWDENSLYVNMFIASKLDWREKKIGIEQVTGFPAEQGSKLTIHVDSPMQFSLKIRIPWWASQGVTWKINGKEQDKCLPSTASYYLDIDRKWNDGDVIELSFPMSLHSERLKYTSNVNAFMYGPIVLVGLVKQDQYSNRDPNVPIDPNGSPLNDWYLLADGNHPELWLEQEKEQPLVFKTHGINRSLTFKPLYKVMTEPYGIYWLTLDKDSKEYKALLEQVALQQQREKQRVIDRVFIGDANSEKEHGFKGESHVAYQAGRPSREGTWGYNLKVLPDAQMTLLCTYPLGDAYARIGDIVVEGKVISTLSIVIDPPSKFVNVEFAIPQELTKDKDYIRVEFKPQQNSSIIPIFGVAMMKPADYVVTEDNNKKIKISEPNENSSDKTDEKGKDYNAKDDFGLSPMRPGAPQK
jgi:DUF1680 family protein